MGTKDPRVDAYIGKSAEFAKPILLHLRELIHGACPTVVETMKWSFPHFTYQAPSDKSPRILCSMASFKQHCAFGFWYAEAADGLDAKPGMGHYGKISKLSDLPKDKELRAFLRWCWLREGYVWDAETGDKDTAKKELVDAVNEGRVVWEWQGKDGKGDWRILAKYELKEVNQEVKEEDMELYLE